ncbi:hypothetical protein KC19_5G022800 [Ceratodon purpureus]|uniref:Uncharacterized protein n=1 Tax=Ceratodon purpureus TaxID=3225 RepID=A0A8T0HZC5_CERPU|nr:hypothetical protein KC19_5G022800 [Ceratodon purpureus]
MLSMNSSLFIQGSLKGKEKGEGGPGEHAGQGGLRKTFRPAVPPLHGAGGNRCSVARLTRCSPLQHWSSPALRRDSPDDSMFGVDRPSTRPRRPEPGGPRPHPPAPARVTGGR